MHSSDLFRQRRVAGVCNICGGTAFGPGPAGRMSVDNKPPGCRTCGSLERHRALRSIFESMPLGLFYRTNVLQFSRDVALEPRWFHTFERSIFGEENSLDLQPIDRPDRMYDMISLNHVMEFVPDARVAFRELSRILTVDGLIQIGFSGADNRPACLHHSEPHGLHGHYHLFGADLPTYFDLPGLGMDWCAVPGHDPATGAVESFHFFSRRREVIRMLSGWSATG
jgi:hypothetical protein